MKKQIEQATEQIALSDKRIEELADGNYHETKTLRQIPGVGALTALRYVLTVADKRRFSQSRDGGCYLGFRPRRSQSGDSDPQLGITKAGDRYLRKLLVQSAHYVLGHCGPHARGGRNAKKRAILAVAGKLSILLHRLWVTQAEYIPFYEVEKQAA